MAEEVKVVALDDAVRTEVMERFEELSALEIGTDEYTRGVKAFKDLVELGRFDDKNELDEDLRRMELEIRVRELDAKLEDIELRRAILENDKSEHKRDFWLEIAKLGVKVLCVVGGGVVYVYTSKLGISAEDKAILFSKNTVKAMNDMSKFAVDTMRGR